jgi:hypothetical protein
MMPENEIMERITVIILLYNRLGQACGWLIRCKTLKEVKKLRGHESEGSSTNLPVESIKN